MTHRLDPQLAAIEQRLERASQPTAKPGLRPRVLAAVADALHEKVPATKSGWSGEAAVLFSPDVVAGTFFLAATAAVLWLVAGWVPQPIAPLTLAERGRIAGVRDEAFGAFAANAHAADPAPRAARGSDVCARQGVLCVFDGHRLLEEIL